MTASTARRSTPAEQAANRAAPAPADIAVRVLRDLLEAAHPGVAFRVDANGDVGPDSVADIEWRESWEEIAPWGKYSDHGPTMIEREDEAAAEGVHVSRILDAVGDAVSSDAFDLSGGVEVTVYTP